MRGYRNELRNSLKFSGHAKWVITNSCESCWTNLSLTHSIYGSIWLRLCSPFLFRSRCFRRVSVLIVNVHTFMAKITWHSCIFINWWIYTWNKIAIIKRMLPVISFLLLVCIESVIFFFSKIACYILQHTFISFDAYTKFNSFSIEIGQYQTHKNIFQY